MIINFFEKISNFFFNLRIWPQTPDSRVMRMRFLGEFGEHAHVHDSQRLR